MPFVLEVVRFVRDRDEWMPKGGKEEHVGYMRAHFRKKKDAASYYDRHTPHMRGLNAHNTWASDWDPITSLMYIVRQDYGLIKTIPPLDPDTSECTMYKKCLTSDLVGYHEVSCLSYASTVSGSWPLQARSAGQPRRLGELSTQSHSLCCACT